MVFTDTGRSGLALAFTGSMALPNIIGIGSGSGTSDKTRTGLIAQVGSTSFTGGSADISTTRFVTFQGDFGAVGMSGINLSEFDVQSADGTSFALEGFVPITFDGTNEAQISITLEVF